MRTLTACFFGMLILAATGCGDDAESLLVGTWAAEDGGAGDGFHFSEDGTFTHLENTGTCESDDCGRYSVSDDQITWTRDRIDSTHQGTFMVSDSTLTITVPGEDSFVVQRVSSSCEGRVFYRDYEISGVNMTTYCEGL